MTAPNPQPPASQPHAESPSESRTRIIRRAPTGPIPTAPESPTTLIPPQPAGYPVRGTPAVEPSGRTAVAACAVSIVSGWATSVVATDLIAGWWRTDRLFCIAVAFLALVFAATTISGVILLLQRRPVGRWLLLVGAVVGFLTYLGIFIAGARVAWIVELLPVLPLATAVLVLIPPTKRWVQA
ncbi:hypothetical protein [Mycobacterium sp. Marseille-P9652]|uniref:hypothetical protein n=1 Tax=Mycobacterium sp. Marseille-P9652 TaxID=2654950 RepID=UPI001E4D451B|nr:hypothetical protein [Mycobacterium sp. Marseille-P9652]